MMGNLCLKKSCVEAGLLWVGRIARESIHSHLPCVPVQDTLHDVQTLVLNVILDKLFTSMDLVTYL